ncbi:MAG: N-acetyltransferase family protein [Ideonella sp.]|nr:N-acetyltransferase family protein [Ideonella sp.]MCC7456596.1 N-acetyltransferase [Nitrospira sp.]
MTAPNLLIRSSRDDDLGAITAIYAEAVRNGSASFELAAPDADEMALRRRAVLQAGLPWLCAERAGTVLGYAYAGPFRPRPAYRFCVEHSIYIDAAARRQGIGVLLLAELVARCEAWGARQMVAVIGDSANAGSIAVHAAAGFRAAGRIDQVGWKFGRWLDVVFMQRALGPGATTAPRDAGMEAGQANP